MKDIANATQIDELIKGNEAIVLDFWAQWCGPCRAFAPMFDALGKDLDGVVFAKVNVDDAKELVARFKIQSIPTIIMLKNGQEVDRLIGAPGSGDALKGIIEKKLLDIE